MSILERADATDVALAWALFNAAADRGLPHRSYGLACVICRTRDRARHNDALGYMDDAAMHGVLEAKVALASSYLYGVGTWPDPRQAYRLYVAAMRFRDDPSKDAADPIYLYNSDPQLAALAFSRAESNGICSPRTNEQHMLMAKLGFFLMKIAS